MGNYNTRAIKFCQSKNDFPLFVSLGEKSPSWGLSRWQEKNSLRFIPPDDEGFTLRGDRRWLVYKGSRRSHRFTILGDGAFEYDCILLREPESNVVVLRMEGAEQYDFLRQPDFVPDDFLKGSYAVYKKETLIGQGTGKLCHIHRPQIIDACGRKCWGELSIVGDCLCITIPEKWLGEAAYPVIVDPTVGTTTIGSQWQHYNDDFDPDYPEDEPEWLQVNSECSIDVSKFLVQETINGSCTAFFYSMNDRRYNERDCGGRPVLYTDQNNKPVERRSIQENLINFYVNTPSLDGWRSGTFASKETIPAGTNIWFGCFVEYFWFFRFDYGSILYCGDWTRNGNIIPNTFPTLYPWQINYKVSMYFTYTSAQNYVRTLTQGVRLTDARSIKADYRRVSAQTARITETRRLTANYKRETSQNVRGTATAKSMFSFFRQCVMNVGNSTGLSRMPVFNRFLFNNTNAITGINNKRELNRKFVDTANSNDLIKRSQGFIRGIIDNIKGTDNNSYNFIFIRILQDTQNTTDTFQQYRNYIRCLYVEAGSIAETTRQGDLYRTASDTVQAEGFVLRHLVIFIKLVSTSLVRDFILRRFLIARQEIVLKSPVCREIILESKIG